MDPHSDRDPSTDTEEPPNQPLSPEVYIESPSQRSEEYQQFEDNQDLFEPAYFTTSIGSPSQPQPIPIITQDRQPRIQLTPINSNIYQFQQPMYIAQIPYNPENPSDQPIDLSPKSSSTIHENQKTIDQNQNEITIPPVTEIPETQLNSQDPLSINPEQITLKATTDSVDNTTKISNYQKTTTVTNTEINSPELNEILSNLKQAIKSIANLKGPSIVTKRNITDKLEKVTKKLIHFESETSRWKELYERETSIHTDNIVQSLTQNLNYTIHKSIENTLEAKLKPLKNKIEQLVASQINSPNEIPPTILPQSEIHFNPKPQRQRKTAKRKQFENQQKINQSINSEQSEIPQTTDANSEEEDTESLSPSSYVVVEEENYGTPSTTDSINESLNNHDEYINTIEFYNSKLSSGEIAELSSEIYQTEINTASKLPTATPIKNTKAQTKSLAAKTHYQNKQPPEKIYNQKKSTSSKFLLMSIPPNLQTYTVAHALNNNLKANININEIKKYTDQHNNTHLIFEAPTHYKKDILNLKHLIIKNTQCSLRSYIPARRCQTCHSYDHPTHACTNKIFCAICAGSHATESCKSDYQLCINCYESNKEKGTNLPVDHPVYSNDCQMFHLHKNKGYETLVKTRRFNN